MSVCLSVCLSLPHVSVCASSVAVGSEVAQGAFSFVYRATDTATGESLALKKIPCPSHAHAQLVAAEIRAHQTFAHPNLMPLEDYAVVSTGAHTLEYYLLFPFMEVRLSVSACRHSLTH